MSIKYEYMLPILSIDIDKINIQLCPNSTIEKNFNIKNISKGMLSGNITTNIPHLSFIPNSWNENVCNIKYTYNSQYLKAGSNLKGRAVVQSNGGELILPINIDITPNQTIINNKKIDSLDTFVDYAKDNFSEAKNIFMSKNFLEICNVIDDELFKLYKRLYLEVYKEIALDNFLIIMNKKQPVKLKSTEAKIELTVKPLEDKKIKYKLPLKIEGWGTIESTISSKQDWIEFSNSNISSINVSDGQLLDIFCIINTSIIKNKFNRGIIEIEGNTYNTALEITVKREPVFSVELSKNYYNMYDKGSIRIINNTGSDIKIEVDTDKFIEFKSKKYFISAYAEIPFDIKFYKTFDLIKVPMYKTTILIKTIIGGKAIKKYIDIKITGTNLQ